MSHLAPRIWTARGVEDLHAAGPGLRRFRERLLSRDCELEIGFGKARYLLQQAERRRDTHFVGVEIVSKYFRLAAHRAERRGLDNLDLLRGEAVYLLATFLPRDFARAVHVYHPDPWPKSRHHRRRLVGAMAIDLLIGALRPGDGVLYFGTDHEEYGEAALETLQRCESLEVEVLEEWPGGPRTNWEEKFLAQGQSIRRIVARRRRNVSVSPELDVLYAGR